MNVRYTYQRVSSQPENRLQEIIVKHGPYHNEVRDDSKRNRSCVLDQRACRRYMCIPFVRV